MTREWLLISLLSVLMSWISDPIKMVLVTLVLAHCKCKKEKLSLRQVGVHRFSFCELFCARAVDQDRKC